MTLLNLDELKQLQDSVTPGPWTVETDDWGDTIIANDEGHRLVWEDQVRFLMEAWDRESDPQLVALAPELLAEVIRLREELAQWREETQRTLKENQ